MKSTHALSPLRKVREAKGLTQPKLAALVQVHPTTISIAERGALSDSLAERIAAALGVSVAEIRP